MGIDRYFKFLTYKNKNKVKLDQTSKIDSVIDDIDRRIITLENNEIEKDEIVYDGSNVQSVLDFIRKYNYNLQSWHESNSKLEITLLGGGCDEPTKLEIFNDETLKFVNGKFKVIAKCAEITPKVGEFYKVIKPMISLITSPIPIHSIFKVISNTAMLCDKMDLPITITYLTNYFDRFERVRPVVVDCETYYYNDKQIQSIFDNPILAPKHYYSLGEKGVLYDGTNSEEIVRFVKAYKSYGAEFKYGIGDERVFNILLYGFAWEHSFSLKIGQRLIYKNHKFSNVNDCEESAPTPCYENSKGQYMETECEYNSKHTPIVGQEYYDGQLSPESWKWMFIGEKCDGYDKRYVFRRVKDDTGLTSEQSVGKRYFEENMHIWLDKTVEDKTVVYKECNSSINYIINDYDDYRVYLQSEYGCIQDIALPKFFNNFKKLEECKPKNEYYLEPVYLNQFDIEFHSIGEGLNKLSDQVLKFRYEPTNSAAPEKIYIEFNESIVSSGLIVYPKLLDLLHNQNEIRIRVTPKKLNGNYAGIFEFQARLNELTPLEFDYESSKQDIMKISTVWKAKY